MRLLDAPRSARATARALPALTRWLGPWADPTAVPAGVSRRELVLVPQGAERHSLRVFVYEPKRRPLGRFVIAHGLNPWGPLDPRANRFARILCHAGFVVFAPALPDFLALRCAPEVSADFARVLEAAQPEPGTHAAAPALLSISFGSLPALRVLADPRYAARVSGAVVFGGYADPLATLRYSLGDRDPRAPAPDPLNAPAVAINLVDGVELMPEARARLCTAWLELARATWGKPELKAEGATQPFVAALAAKLEPGERELFRLGAISTPESVLFWGAALERLRERLLTIDPRPALAQADASRRSLSRVHLMHGRADDVIPVRELDALARAFPPGAHVHRYVTGLYGHTQTTGLGAELARIPELVREVTTFARMLLTVASVPTR